MKKYFAVLRIRNNDLSGGIVYCNPVEPTYYFQHRSSKHEQKWVYSINSPQNEKWDTYWFVDKVSFDSLLEAEYNLIISILEFYS